jgi:transitional endoplasmic reticulum ATPase
LIQQNGKTVSTKALMHDVSKRVSPHIESLYVKTLTSFGGPEYSIRQIFLRARQMAPCLLIFEDIDSLVSPMARSYFLNEVDGLESNHGILMIGSTNHLEQLDPGIAKRPSRFDRKYIFDDPTRDERIQYSEYWRSKLRNNKKVDFPKELSAKIADITDDFSFAYMKEAFVAALMVLVAKGDEKPMYRYREEELSGNIFWQEIKRQIQNLRKEMEDDSEATSPLTMMSGMWPAMSGILDERSVRTGPMDISNNVVPRYM